MRKLSVAPVQPDEFPDLGDGDDPNSWIEETDDEHQRLLDALGEADSRERDPVVLAKTLVDFWNAAQGLG